MKISRIFLATLMVAAAALCAQAQDRKKLSADEQSMYVISAKAGVVNVVEGDVSIKGATGQWDRAIAGEDLPEGASVKTGQTGRAEILLNPGCFLRLNESSEIVYKDGNTYSIKLHLLRGSAIIEAAALDGSIVLSAGETRFEIIRDGLYRFNRTADGKAEIAVRKGKAMLGRTEIKGGKKATVENGAPFVAKLDKKDEDGFDLWSKDRAKTLIALNKKLSQKAMRRMGQLSLLSSVWIYDTSCGCRTWLPGGYGFSSPYGWSYSRCNPYWMDYYWYGNRGGYYGGGNYGGGNSGGSNPGGGNAGGGGGGRPSPPPSSPPRMDPPPRMEIPSAPIERGRDMTVPRRPNGN